MHSWNDNWEHWDELYKAESYFCKMYERCTGLRPNTKEKWGSIRYQAEYNWILNDQHARTFRECIKRTITKFPKVAAEVASGARSVLEDEYFSGWCNGVCFASGASMWTSLKRRNGV